jgi:hypothetical protein
MWRFPTQSERQKHLRPGGSGQVLEKEGKKSEAISKMEESLRLQPDSKPAREDLKRLKK